MVVLERGFRLPWLIALMQWLFSIPEILTGHQWCPWKKTESTEVLRLHLRGWWGVLSYLWASDSLCILVGSAYRVLSDLIALKIWEYFKNDFLVSSGTLKKTLLCLWVPLALDSNWREGKGASWNSSSVTLHFMAGKGNSHASVSCWVGTASTPCSCCCSSVLWSWALYWACKLQQDLKRWFCL